MKREVGAGRLAPGSALPSFRALAEELRAHKDALGSLVSLENGTVKNSQVTQAAGGDNGGSYATFSLNIPTSNLQQAITRMSALHYTRVSSRTDGTQNVSGQYAADQRNDGQQ